MGQEDFVLPADSPILALIHRVGLLPLVLGGVGVVCLLAGVVIFAKSGKQEPGYTITENLVASVAATLIVDIQGAVEKPGVYALGTGARIRDALVAAGGLAATADREVIARQINQAAKISDGQKIYVPATTENAVVSSTFSNTKVAGSTNRISGAININSASLAELDTLSGVGAVTAQKIIDGRPYQRVEELLEKKIVKQSVWEKIKDALSVF